MKNWFRNILIVMCFALLSACGDTQHSSPSGGSLKTVIKPTALTATLNIGGVQMAIALPSGVAPELNADGSVNDAVAVEFISSAPTAYKTQKATYDAVKSVLEFSVIDLAGFSTEDQIVLHLKVAEGTFPKESDFSILSYDFFDKVTGESITGLNPTLITTIQ
ncbi:MAG: hypothetical protein A2076_03710 [Geobacteraceae bacterium GWC2_53_11]|nr:MAG: hypothetical protein A2076_03710 [Geobacteraceae bacterium GWC2_53_11]